MSNGGGGNKKSGREIEGGRRKRMGGERERHKVGSDCKEGGWESKRVSFKYFKESMKGGSRKKGR